MKSEHVDSNCPIHAATPDTTQTGLFCRVTAVEQCDADDVLGTER